MTATIEAHGLTKQYGKTTALDGLDLIAEQGQVTAVLGPNGAGKTTFVRMVATLLRADKGTLLVAGHDARENPRRGSSGDRPGGPVRGRRAGDDRPREPRDDREPVRPEPARGEGKRRRRARATRTRRGRRPAGSHVFRRHAPDGSTSVRVWSALRVCCCSTSRPPAWILAAGSSCGTRSGRSCSPGPTCC